MPRVWLNLKVPLGQPWSIGQVRVPLPAFLLFSRRLDRQLRKLERRMRHKYPPPAQPLTIWWSRRDD